jgi:hypothetical protein
MNERQKYRTYALSQNIYLLSIRQEGQGKDNGYGTQVLALLENEALSVQTYEYIMEVLKKMDGQKMGRNFACLLLGIEAHRGLFRASSPHRLERYKGSTPS